MTVLAVPLLVPRLAIVTVPETACVAGKLLSTRVPETVGVPRIPPVPEIAGVFGKLLIETELLTATVSDTF